MDPNQAINSAFPINTKSTQNLITEGLPYFTDIFSLHHAIICRKLFAY